MTTYLEMIDQELADTLEAVRAGYRTRSLVGERKLAREIVGEPSPPKVGCCVYCGGVAPNSTVCSAHDDLVGLDVPSSGDVVMNSTGAAANLSGSRGGAHRR